MQKSATNRKYFFLAVNTGYTDDGLPNSQCRSFYSERSGNGLYCTIVGNVVIPNGAATNTSCSYISTDAEWGYLAKAIDESGAKPGIQLAATWDGYEGNRKFIPGDRDQSLQQYEAAASELTENTLTRTIEGLNKGSDLAIEHGFQHIQIHAAHGYLFNLLLDPRFSSLATQTGEAISSWAERMRSKGIETSLRFSMRTGHPKLDEEDKYELLDHIATIPVDYLDASEGFYNLDKRLIYPSSLAITEARMTLTSHYARRYPHISFIASGKLASLAEEAMPSNVHIGLCRDLIANPNFLLHKVNGCSDKMKCHYFSRGESKLTCGKWEER